MEVTTGYRYTGPQRYCLRKQQLQHQPKQHVRLAQLPCRVLSKREYTSVDSRDVEDDEPILGDKSASISSCCADYPDPVYGVPPPQASEFITEAPSLSSWFTGIFKSSPHDAAILSLALPAVLALAADPLLQVIDTIFIGQAGPTALAALGVNSALFTFSFLVFNFLATATTPLVAASLANNDRKRAGRVTLQALSLASVLGVGLAAALVFGAEPALSLMGAGPETGEMHDMAKDFLVIRACAAPAVLLMTVGQGAFRAMSDMKTPLSITLVTNGINLLLDAILILDLHWGVKGAATATSTAEWAAAIAYLGLLYQQKDVLGGLDIQEMIDDTKKSASELLEDYGPFLSAGGAVLMRTVCLLGTKTLASATAARLGPIPIAGHQVVMQLWLLSSLVIDSLAVAGQTLVAVQLGRADKKEARAVSDRLLQLGLATGIALTVTFGLSENLIPTIFSGDEGVQQATLDILPLAVAMLPVNALVYVLDGVMVGASDFRFLAGAMVVAAATAVGLLLGVEPLDLGLKGVWGALALLMTSRLVTLLWRYQSVDGPLPPYYAMLPSVVSPPPPSETEDSSSGGLSTKEMGGDEDR